jgi:septum formation protein
MLILASGAKHRKDLLEMAGISVEKMIPADIDESRFKDENIHIYVQRLAKEKALKVAKNNPNSFILGCDTIVCVGKRILGKPANEAEEIKMLDLISGRKVKILTGHSIINPQGKTSTRYIKSTATIKNMTPNEKKEYLDSKEWEGVSGGMCVDAAGAKFIKQINGSYTNIIGVDVYTVINMLCGLGYKN